MRGKLKESLCSDLRFVRLVALLGDIDRAYGRVVRASILADKFWCPNKAPISPEAWAKESLGDELVQVGFVRIGDDGYYFDGTEERNAAWFQRREAGIKGGQARVSKRPVTERQPAVKRPLTSVSDKTDQLEKIYALYPKRQGGQGKTAAFKRLNCLSLTDLERFEKAVTNYAAAMRRDGSVGTTYIKMFSSFASPLVWQDWLEQPAIKLPELKSVEQALREIRLANGQEESA